MDLKHFQNGIQKRFHLNFKPDFFRFLGEAVEARIRATESKGIEQYRFFFQEDPEEVSHLISLLTNKETYFFRENPHYRLVTRVICPELLKNRAYYGQPIKIVSAGCSSGEEPYSLVLALVEVFGEGITDQIEVVGLDIDHDVLHKASMAVYGAYSFRGVGSEVLNNYFSPFAGNRNVLKASIRENVRFVQHNLADWPYPEEARGADLIFYRNVSIYYENETQEKIYQNLARLLTPGGYLVTGSVEISHHDTGRLALKREEEIFYFCKETEASESSDLLSGSPVQKLSRLPDKKALLKETNKNQTKNIQPNLSDEERTLSKALSLTTDEQWEEALITVEELVTKNPDFLSAYSLKALILLQLNRAQETEQVCQQALKKDGLFAAPYLLLGLASQKNTDHPEAVHRLRKAIYLAPSCWLAHYHLADSYRETGDNDSARREYNVTLNLLENSGFENHGLPVFRSEYTESQIAGICRDKLNQLTVN
ncbi:MAG: methyltransferase domain-containing protein [Candidatus Nitronauta litoralis]|uniref:Methyltransferase domain-containing protein n=1 Tax=Candidatus Nitronauta litoralis TaxID=2705533 RepID=A0A7T0G1I6_9BACT|nr:MAG: methyltransferase domain-containing protein [Candidatus Nitronauta litoralis]